MRRVPSSEVTITVELVWVDDGERNFKGMVGGAMTKNQEGVVTGIRETWPDSVLRHIKHRIWHPKPPRHPSLYNSLKIQMVPLRPL